MYGRIIKRTLNSDEVMRLLVDNLGCGPCDGGCLICAKAIIHALGRGTLVRLVHGPTTQHYGALIDGIVYDAHGSHSPRTWAMKFAKAETTQVYEYREGYVDESDSGIPDNLPNLTKMIATILSRALEGAQNGKRQQR